MGQGQVYDRNTMIFDKKIHQKVLCASLVAFKTSNILPTELICLIISQMDAIFYDNIIQDALFHGWLNNQRDMLFPPEHFECHKWTFIGIMIRSHKLTVPHWIFETRVRRGQDKEV